MKTIIVDYNVILLWCNNLNYKNPLLVKIEEKLLLNYIKKDMNKA